MALIVVDASVIIGFLDARDAHHRAAIAALGGPDADDLVLPVTAYAEVLVAPAQRGSAAMDQVDAALAALIVRWVVVVRMRSATSTWTPIPPLRALRPTTG